MWLELACRLSVVWRQTEYHANPDMPPTRLLALPTGVGEGANMEEKWRWKLDESGSTEKTDGGRLKREWMEEGIEMEKSERERCK